MAAGRRLEYLPASYLTARAAAIVTLLTSATATGTAGITSYSVANRSVTKEQASALTDELADIYRALAIQGLPDPNELGLAEITDPSERPAVTRNPFSRP